MLPFCYGGKKIIKKILYLPKYRRILVWCNAINELLDIFALESY